MPNQLWKSVSKTTCRLVPTSHRFSTTTLSPTLKSSPVLASVIPSTPTNFSKNTSSTIHQPLLRPSKSFRILKFPTALTKRKTTAPSVFSGPTLGTSSGIFPRPKCTTAIPRAPTSILLLSATMTIASLSKNQSPTGAGIGSTPRIVSILWSLMPPLPVLSSRSPTPPVPIASVLAQPTMSAVVVPALTTISP